MSLVGSAYYEELRGYVFTWEPIWKERTAKKDFEERLREHLASGGYDHCLVFHDGKGFIIEESGANRSDLKPRGIWGEQ